MSKILRYYIDVREDEDLCICNDLTGENNVELEILDKLTENEICVGALSDMIIRNFKRVEVNNG